MPPHELAAADGADTPATAAAAAAPPADLLAATALRALQLLPGLRQAPGYSAGSFMRLLRHGCPDVRWAAVQAVALLLNMVRAAGRMSAGVPDSVRSGPVQCVGRVRTRRQGGGSCRPAWGRGVVRYGLLRTQCHSAGARAPHSRRVSASVP